MAKKRKAKSAPRAAPRSRTDKLRTLATLAREGVYFYTAKELAKLSGLSKRTVERIRAQPGYKLSDKSAKKIRDGVVREDRKASGYIQKHFNVPKTAVVQIPTERILKSGDRSYRFDVRNWSPDQIIELLRGYRAQLKESGQLFFTSKRGGQTDTFFAGWSLTVGLPKGMVYARDKGDGGKLYTDTKIEDAGNETEHIGVGPHMLKNGAQIPEVVRYNSISGRRIMQVFIYVPSKRRPRHK